MFCLLIIMELALFDYSVISLEKNYAAGPTLNPTRACLDQSPSYHSTQLHAAHHGVGQLRVFHNQR